MGKILVLCVDRDDDIGKKTSIKTPLIGEEANLEAAQALAIADPTESDVNAIYQAISTYRNLKERGEEVEVATIVGHRTRGSKADREVGKQLEALLEKDEFSSLVFVSDGADDDQILPLIQSRIKIEFVETVIVKQTKELEKSYHVIKTALKDPYFARIIFGIPGLIVLIWALTSLANMEQDALKIIFVVSGAYLVIRGFGIEDFVSKIFMTFKKSTSIESASFPLYIGAALTFLISIYVGYAYVTGDYFTNLLTEGAVGLDLVGIAIVYVSAFVQSAVGIFALASIFFFAARMGDMYYGKKVHRIKRYARSMVSVIAISIIVYFGSNFALSWNLALSSGPSFTVLLIWVFISFLITMAGFSVIRYLFIKRYVHPRLKKGLKVKDLKNQVKGEISFIDYKNNYFVYVKEEEKEKTRFGQVVRIDEDVFIH